MRLTTKERWETENHYLRGKDKHRRGEDNASAAATLWRVNRIKIDNKKKKEQRTKVK